MLPQIKYPYFKTNIPSTGQPIQFRPYTVDEEKILLIAVESGDPEEFKTALSQVVSNCVKDCPDVNQLATFDVEHLFIQLRSKSVSDQLDLNIRLFNCPEKKETPQEVCDVSNRVAVKLEDIKLMSMQEGTLVEFDSKKTKPTKIVKFSDDLGAELRYPNYNDLEIIKSIMKDESTEESIGFELLARCTMRVFDEETTYETPTKERKDLEDLIAWYRQIPKIQLKTADDFFKTVPELTYTCKVKCRKCAVEVDYSLRGISNFFA